METLRSTATNHDWAEEYREIQRLRAEPDSSRYWDGRAPSFAVGAQERGPYVERFLRLAGIREGESVLDMGCGAGTLAVPLGREGHEVIAADFSQGMLAQLAQTLSERGIETVRPVRMSWQDDWHAAGVGSNCVDVAVASRSAVTDDMLESFRKLSDAARRRVCITVPTSSFPRAQDAMVDAMGLACADVREHLYALLIAVQAGFAPELSYIESRHVDTFDSFDEAFAELARVADAASSLAGRASSEPAREALRSWLAGNLVDNPDHDPNAPRAGRLRLRDERIVRWAFISWDV